MTSYRNRNQIRQRSREPLDRRMDKWIQTGKQVVDGVAGNRPGQRRTGWQDKTTGQKIEKVGRWMEEKIDWFFEDEDDWLDNEELDKFSPQENTNNSKRPLVAISLRAPKALPPQIEATKKYLNEMDQWPDDQSFRLSRWERKNNMIQQNESDLDDSYKEEQRPNRRRNIPRSSRRKY